MPLASSYTPRKHQETLIFSEVIERDQSHEMGSQDWLLMM